jgi:hypothetical protein
MKGQAFFLAEVPPMILSLANDRVAVMLAGPAPHTGAVVFLTDKRSPTVMRLGYSYE